MCCLHSSGRSSAAPAKRKWRDDAPSGGAASRRQPVATSGPSTSSAAVGTAAGREPRACRVAGCTEPLRGLYNWRYRVCVPHSRAGCVEIHGALQRFCQQVREGGVWGGMCVWVCGVTWGRVCNPNSVPLSVSLLILTHIAPTNAHRPRQCSKFHLLGEFTGTRRSCRASLNRHQTCRIVR